MPLENLVRGRVRDLQRKEEVKFCSGEPDVTFTFGFLNPLDGFCPAVVALGACEVCGEGANGRCACVASAVDGHACVHPDPAAFVGSSCTACDGDDICPGERICVVDELCGFLPMSAGNTACALPCENEIARGYGGEFLNCPECIQQCGVDLQCLIPCSLSLCFTGAECEARAEDACAFVCLLQVPSILIQCIIACTPQLAPLVCGG